MPGGYKHNLPDRIKTTDLYYNSQYKTGPNDSLGYRKFFFNIVKPACDIATKFIDLDTKDIILTPEDADTEIKVWILQKKLKEYLKVENFGVLLNEISFDLPKYGSVVIKKNGKKWQKVNIQNLRFDPTAKSLKFSPFIGELVSMSKGEIEDMSWDREAVDELFSRDEDAESFLVYDFYQKKGKKWVHTVRADLFAYRKGDKIMRSTEAEFNTQNEYIPSITLFEETTEKFPYREIHWERVPGRWLGFGFVEYLEDNQIATNEAENLERAALKFKALNMWQTRDEGIGGQNVFSNSQNGDILKVESEITPLQKDNSDLSAYNNTRANWDKNRTEKTFTGDITTGANLPSRTPLGVANLQASMASSYFELKRENYGLVVKELILEDIIPDFEKSSRKEHCVTFTSSDSQLEKLDQAIAEILVMEAIANFSEKHGFYPSAEKRQEAKQRVLEQIQSKSNRYYDIPKDFYKDAKYILDVNITGESIDNGTKSQVIQLALQIVGTNPAILQIPAAKSMLFALLSLGGINPIDLNLNQPMPQQAQQQQPQVAGSLAVPSPVQGMATSNTQV